MLIGLCGATCAGKNTIADFLVDTYGFKKLQLVQENNGELAKSATGPQVPNGTHIHQRNGAHEPQIFTSLDSLLDFVTRRWLRHCVLTDIRDELVLDALSRRPFFLLISVDAPIMTRWKRYKGRKLTGEHAPTSLEQFVEESDDIVCKKSSQLANIMHRAEMRLVNRASTLQAFHVGLEGLRLADEERLRPSWDLYFMRLASLAAQRSNCMKRRVGCVLVREKRVISTGYNGTPRHLKNCNQGGCARCNGALRSGVSLSACLCLHAEENALLEAGRERIREGAILYCDTCPCLTCSVKIAQVGISEVVYSQSYSMDESSAAIFAEAGIRFRQISAPPSGLVFLEDL